MDPKVADTLRYAFFAAIFLAIGIFGFKQYKRSSAKKQIVAEMRTDVAEANFFRSLREADARATLLRCIGRVEKAQQMGIEPMEFFNLTFERKKKDEPIEENADGVPSREKLVRTTITNAYQHAKQLGFFEEKDSVDLLLNGEMPSVSPPPVIVTIIDPTLSPGLERVVANLQILPEKRKEGVPLTDIEIAASRQLLYDLSDAGIIDRTAEKRLLENFDSAKPAETAPAAQPK